MSKAIRALMIPISFGAGLLMGTNTPMTTEPTYEFIVTASNNNEYVMDFNLTREDCRQRMKDYGDFMETTKGIECRKEM